MSLDLSPSTETLLRQEAAREGVSIDDLIRRAFGNPQPASPKVSDPDIDPEKERVFALLRERQREYGLPPRPDGKTHTSVAELFATWREEDANLTQEEVEAEQRFWEDYQNGHDDRRVWI